MLYASILVTGLLVVLKGQTCQYGPTSEKGKWFSGDRGSGEFSRDGEQQYVVFDFSKLATASIRGEYYLPYLISNDDGDSYCHNSGFSNAATIAFECSTDGETMYAYDYANGDCVDPPFRTYWWEKGYTPYLMDSGAATTMSMCDDDASCANYTRYEVTPGSGSRWDFSCNGSTLGVAANLCIISDKCTGNTCARVLAAVGADCIQTPNSTANNLLISCDSSKNEAYLSTYFDVAESQSGNDWDDYTVNHVCPNDKGKTGFLCNTWTAPETCTELFEVDLPTGSVTVYGQYLNCSENLNSSSSLTYSIMFLFISAFVAMLNH